ncbi:hypothetical protein N781_09455 [Pontibacillus halophilus JSM 076056 = DSM 19796]|uniref:HD domain-containing protein n=1 Tax=Pontibacillus halophilus JSM 076056 = DSM 19796 TaxID=1385510 RepID=A0A0A5G9L1_9BACI|nr:HD domain-containing protein [Pontibacillus halophilus]KGX88734.1 hypothetical protein N781_09455 [Pontibacillus halophilus JSM 076056 = DSM 19796]
MKLTDKLYGTVEVEPVLAELVRSKPIQRLKGIHQAGASYLVEETWNVTRYEHSVGVMLLIRRLGGTVEEQVAGLLHDVSHTAFSHVVDTVLNVHNEDYHEHIFEEVVMNSEIPSILNKHGMNVERVFQEEQWTLLEQPAPLLCADRIDYTLRDLSRYGYRSIEDAQQIVRQFRVEDGLIYLDSVQAAERFTEWYYEEVIGFFMNPKNMFANYWMANLLKESLQKGIISRDDFLLEDQEVVEKLLQSNDKSVIQQLRHLQPSSKVVKDEHDYDFHQRLKVRLIDPSILVDGQLVKASQQSVNVKRMGEEARRTFEGGVRVKVVTVPNT